jgi:hypothetical protein
MPEQRVYFNPNQTQTLVQLQIFLYFRAVIGLLFALATGPIGIALLALTVAAAYGVANEKQWGYYCAIAYALISGFFSLYALTASNFAFDQVISALFTVILVVLTFHPESRAYVKTWFK